MKQNKTSLYAMLTIPLQAVNKRLLINGLLASFGASLFCTSLYVQAITSPSEQLLSLHNLIENKQYSEAYALSKGLLEEYGGEPEFDFYAGRAAYHSNHHQEAVFAFERVMINRPKHLQARLLLAFSYFKVKNYGAAKVELNWFLRRAKQIKDEDLSRIRDYLTQIEEFEQKSIRYSSFEITTGVGYDSNVNSGTDTDQIFFPSLGDFIVITDGVEKEDTILDVSLTYKLREKLSQKSSYTLQANLSQLAHEENSELDRSVMNLTGNYTDSWGSMRYSVTGYIQPMLLDADYYRTAYGLMVDGSWKLSENWMWTLGLNTAIIDNVEQDTQDMHRIGASIRFTYASKHPQIIDIYYTDDDADEIEGEHNGKDYYGLSYSYIFPYSNNLNFSLRLSADNASYDKIHPTFLLVREDETLAAALIANYILDKDWRISSLLRYSNKNSNISIYEFDRAELKLTASRIF